MDIELKETFDRISIVTMCFNMGMNRLNKVKNEKIKRGEYQEYYVESVRKLCKLFYNVIVFCDLECADILHQDEGCREADIHIMKLEDLPTWSYVADYFAAYKNMAKTLELRRKLHIPEFLRDGCIVKGNCHAENAEYTALNHAKPYLLKEAVIQNPFRTDYFYWIDGGCLTDERYRMFWEGYNGTITYKPRGVQSFYWDTSENKKVLGCS